MLQIDSLLTFAIGCSLATAAGDGLKATQYHTQNRYFIFMLLHISIVVAPLNVYMLWEHTGFETMFYYDASMHGIWPSLNVAALTLSGIAGFMSGRKLVRFNKELTAYTVWTSAHTMVLAIVNSHYDRLFYPGSIRDFYDHKTFGIKEFLHSELIRTLLISLLLMAAPVFYAQIFWPRIEGYMTKSRKSRIKWHCLRRYIQEGFLAGAAFTVIKLAGLTPSDWGWDRLLAIEIGHMVGLLLLLPVFLMSTRYTVTKRIDIRRSRQQQTTVHRRRRPSNTPSANGSLIPDPREPESQQYEEDGEEAEPLGNGHINHITTRLDSNAKQE